MIESDAKKLICPLLKVNCVGSACMWWRANEAYSDFGNCIIHALG